MEGLMYLEINLKSCVICKDQFENPAYLTLVKEDIPNFKKFAKTHNDNTFESYHKPQKKAIPPGRCILIQNVVSNILIWNLLWLL